MNIDLILCAKSLADHLFTEWVLIMRMFIVITQFEYKNVCVKVFVIWFETNHQNYFHLLKKET